MKWLIQLIKKIFIKKQINPDIVIEDVVIKDINWKAINRIKAYSLVLVRMTQEEIEKDKIEINHQKRPFIVEDKDDENEMLTGYYLTSNVNSCVFNKNRGLRLVLDKDFYRLNKNSLVLLNEKINLPFENVIFYFEPVNNIDLMILKKYRNLICGIPTISNKENNVIEIGDIVFYDNFKYIIFQVDNTRCYGYAISKVNSYVDENPHYIKYNKSFYFVDYQNHRTFSNIEELSIIDRLDYETVSLIIENKRILKVKNKVKKKNA